MPSAITPVLARARNRSQSCMVPVAWALAIISSVRCRRRKSRTSSRYSSSLLSTSKSTGSGPHREQCIGQGQVLALAVLVHKRPAPSPAVEELDVVLAHDAVAAVEVEGAGRRRLRQL